MTAAHAAFTSILCASNEKSPHPRAFFIGKILFDLRLNLCLVRYLQTYHRTRLQSAH